MRIRSTKPEFWDSVTIQVIEPKLVYDGPILTGRRQYADIAPATACTEYVYLLFGEGDELVYIGRSFRPSDRFTKHRRRGWWADVRGLVLLRVRGASPQEALTLTRVLERRAISHLKPTKNIVGVAA